jgi:hypothetical protein
MIKLQTGISTDRDFVKAMKERGQKVSAEFPAETLRKQLDNVSKEVKVTFESTNETVLASVNADEVEPEDEPVVPEEPEAPVLVTVDGVAYSSLEEAIGDVADGATIMLADNVDLETAAVIDKEITINLDGHDLTVKEDTVGDGVFHVVEGGTLILDGNGTVDGVGKSPYTMAIWADGGDVIINGGTYTNVGSGDEEQYDLIYAKNGSVITINGGLFMSETPKWTLNRKNGDSAQIIVKGGTFVEFNPAVVDTEPEEGLVSFVAEGYTVVEENGNFTVVPEETE